jgi:hypothetical protein
VKNGLRPGKESGSRETGQDVLLDELLEDIFLIEDARDRIFPDLFFEDTIHHFRSS